MWERFVAHRPWAARLCRLCCSQVPRQQLCESATLRTGPGPLNHVLSVLLYGAGAWIPPEREVMHCQNLVAQHCRAISGWYGTQQPDGTWRKSGAEQLLKLLGLPDPGDLIHQARHNLQATNTGAAPPGVARRGAQVPDWHTT